MTATTPQYDEYLSTYLRTRDERALYQASLLGQGFVEAGLGPDDIVALHSDAMQQLIRSLPSRVVASASVDALQFLLEVMIAFGVHHQRYLELRLAEQSHALELSAAEQRQRAQDAEQADREKSGILAAIAHELRTPVTAASGLIELAFRALEREQLPRATASLRSAQAAVQRLARLATDLVEASRGEAPTFAMSDCDLAAIVAQAVDWAQTPATEKGVELIVEPVLSPVPVLGDADALQSVVTNLLTNSIRYTPAGGRITVRTECTDQGARVTVADTGIGMTPEVQARIFEKFYRGEEARVQEARGLGLGLALARQLVESHHGQIAVTSASGKGSVFAVTLPAAATEEAGHG